MLELYPVQPAFYTKLKQHRLLLKDLVTIEQAQKELIFQYIDFEDIYLSACSYFGERILMEHDSLILKDMLNERQFQIECYADHICLDDKDNPFYSLLERKYNNHCIVISNKDD